MRQKFTFPASYLMRKGSSIHLEKFGYVLYTAFKYSFNVFWINTSSQTLLLVIKHYIYWLLQASVWPLWGVYYIQMKPAYLGGKGGQLSPHHCSHRAGPDGLGSLPVWTSAGFGGWWTGAEASASSWGQRSPLLLGAANIRRGAASGWLYRAWCPWLVEWIGSESENKRWDKRREHDKKNQKCMSPIFFFRYRVVRLAKRSGLAFDIFPQTKSNSQLTGLQPFLIYSLFFCPKSLQMASQQNAELRMQIRKKQPSTFQLTLKSVLVSAWCINVLLGRLSGLSRLFKWLKLHID